MIILLDADMIVCRCGYASERKRWLYGDGIEFDYKISKSKAINHFKELGVEPQDDKWHEEMQYDDVGFALGRAKAFLKTIFEELGTDVHKGFLGTPDDKTLFRHAIAKTQGYKANRKEFKRPFHYQAIREYLLSYYNITQVQGIESDDALAMHQSKDTIIVSIDKDLLQIPGRHYNPIKKSSITISETEGWRNFYRQVLTGDTADNVPGLFRIGQVTADKILEGCKTHKEMYEACVETYKKRCLKENYEEYLKEQINLLYLIRKPNDRWRIPE